MSQPKPVSPEHLRYVGAQFQVGGKLLDTEPYGSGHINDTFKVIYEWNGSTRAYIHQRINQHVFPHVEHLMENIDRVTAHLRTKLEKMPGKDIERCCLQVIPCRSGKRFYRDDEGEAWRTYNFVPGTRTYDVVKSPQMAFEAARAFGEFQKLLEDFPEPALHETIPYFHDTPVRLKNFENAVALDSFGRVKNAQAEIDFVRKRAPLAELLLQLHHQGEFPLRVTHNDTKLNNVLLDEDSGDGICIVDLETVMPGLSLYDLGDLIRTASHQAAEDERDLSRVHVDPTLFEALVQGYLSMAGSFLKEAEKEHLLTSGKLITLETGMRFLTDYLEGDHYFKTHREQHNLDRCRTQFALIRSMEQQEADLLAACRATS